MMELLKRFFRRQAEKRRLRLDAEIESRIAIEERAGRMWPTCEGTAILAFPLRVDSEDMLETAERTRRYAKAYSRHTQPD